MSDHEFESDGYGHGECKHCGKVEALHGDVIAAAYAEGERAATERIVTWLRSEADAAGGRNEPDSARDYRAMTDAIERGEHNE